jgi:uncharacterized protein (DUF779 family)
MAERAKVEKFSELELANLRFELSKDSFDSWQTSDIICDFLTGRGYGVSTEHVRNITMRVNGGPQDFQRMQEELEKVAFVM